MQLDFTERSSKVFSNFSDGSWTEVFEFTHIFNILLVQPAVPVDYPRRNKLHGMHEKGNERIVLIYSLTENGFPKRKIVAFVRCPNKFMTHILVVQSLCKALW
jgi:hypothetical protein